ncbi:hypothetical protein [Blastococcus haudaquaticus]|uniref:Excreted virulence factor EspC, type VII ESX diderm n=1 Tax=Blastococcus haudaquaticus TaxID=1938745 RepID=A0A286GYV0_9ACTN|nr:hypothetical protein [Blastococcus haudaquaticus]SOE00708.1 hypothetical protein SAMN06272739_2741 [Blastococcus haudaquaticus]
MSSPSPADALLLRPDAVVALADELTVLAAELSDDADSCRGAAGSVARALDGDDGWTAGAAATAWAGLGEVLAERAAALARTMTGAVQASLDHDAGLAGGMGAEPRGPR